MPPYPLSDKDVEACQRQAWRYWRAHDDWRLEPSDLAHDALLGLYMASTTYDPAKGDWALHRTVKVGTAIANGVRSEMTRRRILNTITLPSADEENDIAMEELRVFLDPHAKTDSIAESREVMNALVRVLGLESALVWDAVLRVDDDTAIARRYATSLSNVAQRRRVFLERFWRTPDAVLYHASPPAKCSRCNNYATPGETCTSCRAFVTNDLTIAATSR